MRQNRFNFIIDLVMILVIDIVLVVGLAETLACGNDINYYENRKANKLTDVTFDGFWSGDSQDVVELAFADQLPFATTMKKKYNFLTHLVMDKFYLVCKESEPNSKYINLNGINRMDGTDYLVWKMRVKEDIVNDIDVKIANINSICKKYPEIDFYLYYIEKDTDIDFDTNEKLGMYEYIADRLTGVNIRSDKFEIDSFDEYKENFYKTDHHWNYNGSYRAYLELCELMGIKSEIKIPIKKFKMNNKFCGSKALTYGLLDLYSEEFEAYFFDIPRHETFISGKKRGAYGRQDECLLNRNIEPSYGSFYGWDDGEVVLDFNRPDRENVLFIGESYDNAILRLMGSHFNKMYAVDLRNYEFECGREFSFRQYVEKNKIDCVVFIGNVDYYVMSEFILEE